jgi:hypothetical protein
MSLSARTGERVQSSTILSNCLGPVGIKIQGGDETSSPAGVGLLFDRGKRSPPARPGDQKGQKSGPDRYGHFLLTRATGIKATGLDSMNRLGQIFKNENGSN